MTEAVKVQMRGVVRQGVFNRWYIFHHADAALAWSGAQWVPTNDGIPTGGVQVCNFDTSDDAVDYAGKSGLSLDTVEGRRALMQYPKATLIRVEFEDGTLYTAEGDQAAQIWDWYRAGEGMNCIHGAEYKGPRFTESTLPGESGAGGASRQGANMSKIVADIQVEISDDNVLTFTTPDGTSASRQYPTSWSNEEIMTDFSRLLQEVGGRLVDLKRAGTA